MRPPTRFAFATLMAGLLATAAGAVAAGNYAEVGYTDGMEAPPTAGEEREIRFSLLQHGVTPVDHGQVTLTATIPGSTPVTVEATSLDGGDWVATMTFPIAGDWQLRVLHSEFQTPPAVAVSVTEAVFTWPASVLPIAGIGLVALVLMAAAAVMARRASPAPAARTEPSTRSVSRDPSTAPVARSRHRGFSYPFGA